jgi:uncharacterized protein
MLDIIVDADACPVKQEVYRVARRCGLKVTLVSNSQIQVPGGDWIELVKVGDSLDAADDWIADHVAEDDIVVSWDIPLVSRCLKNKARVLSPKGYIFTEASIGNALATRDLLTHLRETGLNTGGPPPFTKRDRSQFLQNLDRLIQTIRKAK